MKAIKTLLFVVLLLTLAAGGLYAASNRGLLPAKYSTQIASLASSYPQLGSLATTARDQVTVLSSKAGNVASHSGLVLGSAVETDKAQPPLPQRAFELARYSYCQEVIKDYETRFPSN